MPITIITTPGATSNSYVTLEEADAYMETHLKAADWAALDEEVRKAAVVAATREIDMYRFGGRRASQEQFLAWPRTGIQDYDGYTVDGVPTKLKHATIELAMWNIGEGDRLADNFALDKMDSVEVGPLKYKLKADASAELPSVVKKLINAIGPGVSESVDAGGASAKVMVL